MTSASRRPGRSWATPPRSPRRSRAVPQPDRGLGAGPARVRDGLPDSPTDDPTNPGDWDPACDAVQLNRGADDDIWSRTYTLPAGDWAFKAAINRSWDENYGAKAVPGGGGHRLPDDGDDRPGHVLLRPPDALGDQRRAGRHRRRDRDLPVRDGLPGRQQRRLPARLAAGPGRRRRLQPLDHGGTARHLQRPAGGRRGARGEPTTFTVAAGDATRFTYDPGSHTITAVSAPPPPTG